MENQKAKSIGILDSGLGGLTVVRELERILPQENIVYFGDNANCPYGNRTKEDILNLTLSMLDFLQQEGVKSVAVACNTISVLIDELRKHYRFPIVSIIEEACKFVAKENIEQVGVFATEFTINQGLYKTLIGRLRPATRVYGVSSRTLAALIDDGRFYDPATDAEISSMINKLRNECRDVKHIVLGCTHYPIVQDIFEKAAPDITFINPAAVQAEAVKALLTERDLLNDIVSASGTANGTASQPLLNINTSGKKQPYEAAIKKLEISRAHNISVKE